MIGRSKGGDRLMLKSNAHWRTTGRMADMQSKSRWIARRGLPRIVVSALGVVLALVLIPVASAAAAITITEPTEAQRTGPLPGFAGTTGELAQVYVKIYKGSSVSGSPVELGPSELPLGGTWNLQDETALKAGEYTAVAEQPGALFEPGPSEPIHFTVDTKPPTVTLKGLAARSNVAEPTFEGTASEPGTVTVHVHEGSTSGGRQVTSFVASVGAGGAWSVTASPALADGTYTAVATEPSAIGNKAGESEPPSTFEVFTKAPAVAFTKVPEARSKQTKPTFEGTTMAGETEAVLVHVHEGPGTSGRELVTLQANPSGGHWSVTVGSALADGQYTAQATQKSSIGNGIGTSEAAEFEVFTGKPEVRITHGPESRSRQSKPTFEGEASETEPVTVDIFEGSGTGGKKVTSLSATVEAHKWHVTDSSGLADAKYTAVAKEPSAIGNEDGESGTVEFEVFTKAPAVEITHGPEARSGQSEPSFEGTTTAAETEQITVHIYDRSGTSGKQAAALTVTPSGGKWSVTASSPLPDGEYTAQATQPSSIGNGEGESGKLEFEIETHAPIVTLQPLAVRSKVSKPPFAGSVSEAGPVTVHVHEGSTDTGKELTSYKVTATKAGGWSVTPSTALPDATYTAVATEPSGIGNGPGESEPRTFTIYTKAPAVTITHGPETRSRQTKPAFEGSTTAGETEAVTVHIYEGSGTSGREVVGLTATPSGSGSWSVAAPTALPAGTYTAVATQPSSIENGPGTSGTLEFEIVTGPPVVKITKGPEARSKQSKPTFEGEASETESVTVHIHEGSGTGGPEVATLPASVESHKWHVTDTAGLADGNYTAVAVEPSSLGNGNGESAPVEFEVFTKVPAVTFTKVPAARSKQTKPTFEGTTTPAETGQLTVHVYEGSGTGGKEAAELKVTPSGGTWSVTATTALHEGRYTAQATQTSSLGNGTGASEAAEFEVITAVPTVKITHAPATRSKQSEPSFEGEASETEPVTVDVYEGSGTGGKKVASLSAPVNSHKWQATDSGGLADGKYTAVALEPSSLGNGEGESEAVEFEVFTKAPAVVFTKAPATRSKQTKPTFEGTTTPAAETEQVTVHVYEGSALLGDEVATLKATPSGGKWSVTATSTLAGGSYTAQATQPSSIGNGTGASEVVEFEVDTAPPTVTITHGPEKRSKQTKPTFEGEASETEVVTVAIFEGSGTGGKKVASLSAPVSEHKWHVTATSALAEAKYTAQASEPSSLGNAEGKSEPPLEFEVVTKVPAVTITHAPEARSSQTKPTFEGTTTAGETQPVVVHVYEGHGTTGKEAATLQAVPSGGKWSVTASSALVQGAYTAQATEESSLENGSGTSGTAEFEVVTGPPVVAFTKVPAARSKQSKPTFEGTTTAGETGQVTVHVYEGHGIAGKEAVELKATPSGGKWSVTASATLPDGPYTAQAAQVSSLGNGEGKSEAVEFEVFTKAPAVVFSKVPAARSNQTKPAFEGTTTVGETEPVTVRVYEGVGTGGKVAVELKATPSGGKWSVTASAALGNGKYTAQASQPSSLGNSEGKSETAEFEVFTGVPIVKITHGPEKRSKQTKPTFEGEASETEPVTVAVYEGSGTGGKKVASLGAGVAEHKWHVTDGGTLAEGKYTAVALEPSSLGNAEGESEVVEFEVVTIPPAVVFTKVPAPRSKQTKPTFEGTTTAAETGQVTVHVYEGHGTAGKEAAELKATPSGGKWSVTASATLPDGPYTAQAAQTSSLGNGEGKSEAVEFEVFTKAPAVAFSKVPAARSSQTKPAFEGTTTAGETESVTVRVYEGAGTGGKVAVELKATPSGGKWSMTASAALGNGKYTAQAVQASSLGNSEGKSETAEFEIFVGTASLQITHGPEPRSKQTKPAFEGTSVAGESEPVSVHIYEGRGTNGREVAKLTTTPSSDKWSIAAATELGNGEYTAQATQPSSIGNGEAKSETVEFEVFTNPPTVKITHGPETRSKQSKPTFEGEASETEPVTVHIYEGSGTAGKVLGTLKATVSEHKWHVTEASALNEGKYTAQATEPSSLGNAEGKSEPPVEFEVVSKVPAVAFTTVPATRSKQTKPLFEGTTTPAETEPVTVHVYEGSGTAGKVAAELKATPSAGKWSVAASSALPNGIYTAQATQLSSLGNGEGKSEAVQFEVFTLPPTVKIAKGPEPRSKQTKPTFEGEASETEPVTVRIYEGSGTAGQLLVSLQATVTEHKWHVTSGVVFPDGEYTAQAAEPSSLGNAEGKSEPAEFEVFTEPPAVKITKGPEPRSKQNKPAFEGTTTAGETGQVTVHVYEGSGTTGKVAASLTATPSNGKWSVAAATALPDGEYTAQATQPSSLGNGEGKSGLAAFQIYTKVPAVKITKGPGTRSNVNEPAFEGTTTPGETTPVTVHIYEGSGTAGKQITSLEATPSGTGSWSVTASSALPDGEYTAQAAETSSIGNGEGKSETVVFEVFTQPPAVKITKAPEKRSNVSKPALEGTTTPKETAQITIHVYEGSGTAGKQVAALNASQTGEKWSAAVASTLADGIYTAQATQPSSIGNGEGKSETVEFEIFTGPPAVKITHGPGKRSNVSLPAFEGTTTAKETTQVTVHIYEGSGTAGKVAASLNATPSSGKWSVAATTALPDGTYTAQATEPSSIGNGEGKTETIEFEIFTKPPTVEITHGPEARSNQTKPSFEGKASETEPVTLRILEGPTQVASLKVAVSEHKWHAEITAALADGRYTAVASENSAIGNEPGESAALAFEIDTKPPALECSAPQARSGNATPAFSGASNESVPVFVNLYNEKNAIVETLEAHPASGKWTTSHVSPELQDGTYKEVAEQESGIGNAAASCSHEFEVALAPTVTLTAPKTPSKNTTPSFSGTTSEKAPVKISVYEGLAPEGPAVAEVKANVTEATCTLKVPCKWSTAPIPALFIGRAAHVYTAIAEQESTLNQAKGASEPQTFEVNTEPPRVTITPIGSEVGKSQSQPAFTGTASDPKEPVTVHVHEGASSAGKELTSVKTIPSEGRWTAPALTTALNNGQYTVVATQPSSLENPAGESAAMTFTVNKNSPVVTLNQVPTPTSDAAPEFSGKASDPKEKVTVHVYRGAAAEGQPVASVEAEVTSGNWTSPSLADVGESLEDGEYTAVAVQPSSLKNAPGKSQPISFTIEVQPPTVTEVSASTNRSAALMNASVDANGGRLSTCRFEYGTTSGYGREKQCAFEVPAVPAGCPFAYPAATPECEFPLNVGTHMYARVNGLPAGTTYFFRIVTENEHGNGNEAIGEGSFRTASVEVIEETHSTTTTSTTGTTGIPSDAVLAATIVKELAPTGKNATIPKLLQIGGYKALFKAGTSGTAVLGWYYLPKGASLAKKSKKAPKPVLVAAGKITVSGASGATIKIGLTPAGRKLLKGSTKLKLTAECSFTPKGETTAIVTYQTFTLKR
jgi:large repetitive protein